MLLFTIIASKLTTRDFAVVFLSLVETVERQERQVCFWACAAGSVSASWDGDCLMKLVQCRNFADLQRRGQQLCIETGLSRHLRNLSDLHIWPLELLEEEEIHPF